MRDLAIKLLTLMRPEVMVERVTPYDICYSEESREECIKDIMEILYWDFHSEELGK
jgi:hypothetical protein